MLIHLAEGVGNLAAQAAHQAFLEGQSRLVEYVRADLEAGDLFTKEKVEDFVRRGIAQERKYPLRRPSVISKWMKPNRTLSSFSGGTGESNVCIFAK
jgi:hypothetical protein